MASLNKFIGIGNLTRDPEVKYMPSGNPVTSGSIAINEKYKNKQNELVETTEYINVVFYGKLAEIVGQYLKKGSSIYIEGKLKTEKYVDKDGIQKTTTKIVADTMLMLNIIRQDKQESPQKQSGGFDDMKDDIPF